MEIEADFVTDTHFKGEYQSRCVYSHLLKWDTSMVVSLLEVYSLGLQPCVISSFLERKEVNEVAEAKVTF